MISYYYGESFIKNHVIVLELLPFIEKVDIATTGLHIPTAKACPLKAICFLVWSLHVKWNLRVFKNLYLTHEVHVLENRK